MLLAMRDREGPVASGSMCNFAIGGAVLAELMMEKRIDVEAGRVLKIFTRRVYPEVDPQPEREIVARLNRAISWEGGEIDPRTVILLSLAKNADLLKLVFDRKQLKGRKARIAQVISGELTGKATQEAIQAMEAAVMVACVIPAIMVSTTAGS